MEEFNYTTCKEHVSAETRIDPIFWAFPGAEYTRIYTSKCDQDRPCKAWAKTGQSQCSNIYEEQYIYTCNLKEGLCGPTKKRLFWGGALRAHTKNTYPETPKIGVMLGSSWQLVGDNLLRCSLYKTRFSFFLALNQPTGSSYKWSFLRPGLSGNLQHETQKTHTTREVYPSSLLAALVERGNMHTSKEVHFQFIFSHILCLGCLVRVGVAVWGGG